MNYKHTLFFAACLMGLNANSQSTLVWDDVDTVIKDLAFGNTRPKVALTRNNVPVVMWGRGLNKEVFVARHNGSGFDAPVKVSPDGMNTYTQNWVGPDMVAKGDTVYVTFKSLPESQGFVYVVKSIDGGKTFGDTVRVSDDVWSRFPSLGIRPNGNPIVTYMEFDSGYHDPRYVVCTSVDGGLSFSSPVDGTSLADGEACDCCPGFVTGSNEETYLMFRNNDNNIRDIWASKSINGGSSFPTQQDVDPNEWEVNSCPSTGPDAFLTSDSIIATWMSASSGNTRINVGSRDRSTLSIGQNIELIPEATEIQNYPKIEGEKKIVGVTWKGSTSGNPDILFKWSETGVSGLKNAVVDTVNPEKFIVQMNPDIEYSEKTFHFIWQDQFDKSVKYRSARIEDASGVYKEQAKASWKVYPVPADAYFELNFGEYLDVVEIHLYNSLGQCVYQKTASNVVSVRVETGHLSEGVYSLVGHSSSDIISEKVAIRR